MSQKDSFLHVIWKIISNNLGTKIISLMIAIVLWGIVLGSRNVEVTKEVPLEVITSNEIVPANEIPDKIAFRLSGPKAFLRGILDRKEDPIRVNLTGAKPALVTYRFFSDNIRVPIGVKVLSINPTAILIKLEFMKRRELPVRINLRGSLPEGYRIVRATVTPEVVRVKGAESKVDSLTEVSTVPIDVTGIKKTFEKEVPIDLSRYNVQLESEFPKVQVEIEPVAANFKIKNVDLHVLTSHRFKLEPKNVTVLVRANQEDLEALGKSQVFGVIDVTGKPKGKYTESVKVTLPKNIDLVKVEPEQVNVIVY